MSGGNQDPQDWRNWEPAKPWLPLTVERDEDDRTDTSYDEDRDAEQPVSTRFARGSFTVDDPAIATLIQIHYPGAPARLTVFPPTWTPVLRRLESDQNVLIAPNGRQFTLTNQARVERIDRCGPCTRALEDCLGGFPCIRCAIRNMEDQCHTSAVIDWRRRSDYYDGPRTLHSLIVRPTIEHNEATTAGAEDPAAASRMMVPTAATAASSADAAGYKKRCEESPSLYTLMPQDETMISLPELLTFLPRWIRRRGPCVRLLNAGAGYADIAGMINYQRDYRGFSQQSQPNTVLRALSQTMRLKLGIKGWNSSTHNKEEANKALDEHKKDKKDVGKHKEVNIPLKDLIIGVINPPLEQDQWKVTPAAQWAAAHPDEPLMFPDDVDEAAQKQLASEGRQLKPHYRADDEAMAAWSEYWAKNGAQWHKDHAVPGDKKKRYAPPTEEQREEKRKSKDKGKKEEPGSDEDAHGEDDPDYPGQ